MYAKNCTREDLENAAGLRWRIKIEDRGSKGLMFTLTHYDSSNSKYFRGMRQIPDLDGKRRRSNYLCLHEHYRYFERLFAIAPSAVVSASRMGRVTHTKETLHDNYENMRYQVVRQWDNLVADDCCNCGEEDKP